MTPGVAPRVGVGERRWRRCSVPVERATSESPEATRSGRARDRIRLDLKKGNASE